jgi:hypothetical protein
MREKTRSFFTSCDESDTWSGNFWGRTRVARRWCCEPRRLASLSTPGRAKLPGDRQRGGAGGLTGSEREVGEEG